MPTLFGYQRYVSRQAAGLIVCVHPVNAPYRPFKAVACVFVVVGLWYCRHLSRVCMQQVLVPRNLPGLPSLSTTKTLRPAQPRVTTSQAELPAVVTLGGQTFKPDRTASEPGLTPYAHYPVPCTNGSSSQLSSLSMRHDQKIAFMQRVSHLPGHSCSLLTCTGLRSWLLAGASDRHQPLGHAFHIQIAAARSERRIY